MFSPEGPGTGDPAVLGLGIHQHDIWADPLDAAPRNHIILPVASQSQRTASARHNDGADPSLRKIHQNIADESQPGTGADADDLLALKVCKFAAHKQYLHLWILVQPMQPERRI